MALHSDTKIFKATSDLLLLVTKFVSQMQRNYKADFGADLRRDCMRLVRLVYRVNTMADKVTPLKVMREELAMVEMCLRLAMDLQLISKGQYGQVIEITNSIGRQATGWLQHSEKALVPQSSRRPGQRVN